MADFINEVADESGKGLSDSRRRKAADRRDSEDPTAATLELVKSSLRLAAADQRRAGQGRRPRRSKADVTINPRYGTFDPQAGPVRREHAQLDQGRAAAPTAAPAG